MNVEIYNGHIRQTKELSLTIAALEETLQRYKYSGENRIKDPVVEDLVLPPITLSFYSCIYKTGLLPSDSELVEEYLNQEGYFSYVPENRVEVTYSGKSTVVSLEGLIGRVLRTYPSLVRDFHFYLMAHESNLFSAVRYSVSEDYGQGIDIKVQYNSKWYNVGLCLSSRRSLLYKAKKAFRHKPVDIIYIELQKNEAQIVGDYMLYTEKHIHKLLKSIE